MGCPVCAIATLTAQDKNIIACLCSNVSYDNDFRRHLNTNMQRYPVNDLNPDQMGCWGVRWDQREISLKCKPLGYDIEFWTGWT